MIYVTGCSSPLAMQRYKHSFVLSAAKRSRGLEPWQWRTAACRRPKQRQGRLELRRTRAPLLVRGLSQFRFLLWVQGWSRITRVIFFWQTNICKFLFCKKLNQPFPVAFCDICKGLLRLLEFIDWQESHIITWNKHTNFFSSTHTYVLMYILSCISPV